MSGGKQSPRAKMIGMMYLVLTALLALNVSKEILNSFVIVNEGLQQTNENFGKKNEKNYVDFEKAKEKDPAKVTPYYDRAMTARKISEDLVKYIEDLKKQLVIITDDKDEKAADTLKNKMMGIDSKDNYDKPTFLMIGSDAAKPKDGQYSAKELKQKIEDARASLIKLFDDEKLFLPGTKAEMTQKVGMATNGFKENGVTESWETGNFDHVPLVACITRLSLVQAEVLNAEADVIAKLLSAVKGKDFTFDKLTGKVIAPSSYILQGSEYNADVLLVAFNSTQSPKILIGEIDTAIHDENVNPLKGPATDSLKVSGGMGKYQVPGAAEGLQKWSGVIKVEKPGGGFNYYPFASEYMVARPALVVSPTKMNVLYIGVDNPLDISVPGVAAENLSPSLSGGTLGSGGKKGSYIARVSSGTEATVNVSAKFGGESKPMGNFKFRVKRVPDPVSYVAGKKGDDVVSKGELLSIQGVIPKLENFDFDLKFIVSSFDMSMMVRGVFVTESSQSNGLTANMSKLLASAGTGTKVYFENVRAKGPDGTVRKIPGVNLKVK